jgi:hypothetical protein
MAVEVMVGVPAVAVAVGVIVALGVVTNGTDVQVGAFVRVGRGGVVGEGVQVGGWGMTVEVGVGVKKRVGSATGGKGL